MAQPTNPLIVWASDDVILPNAQRPNKSLPSESLIKTGWDLSQKPAADEGRRERAWPRDTGHGIHALHRDGDVSERREQIRTGPAIYERHNKQRTIRPES